MAEARICNNAANIRLAIQMKRSEITRLLSRRPFEIRQMLRPIFTDEEATLLGNECDNHGSVGHAKMIIEKVLVKSDAEVETFLEKIKEFEEEPEIYVLIAGNLEMGNSQMKRLGTHIRRAYKERKCNLVRSLPGEEFILDLNKHQYVMSLVLKTEQLKNIYSKTHDLLPKSRVKFKYKRVNFNNIEDIAYSLCHDQHASHAVVQGIAGTGKSISAQRLICLWVAEDQRLKDFDIVLVIPVRSIDVKNSIINIFGEGEKGLGLVKGEMKDNLDVLLGSESCQILIVVDGVDEVDIPENNELFQFIIGEKYPNVKKIITTRPEAAILTRLEKNVAFCPNYRVEVQGTNRKGVYKYLKAVMSSGDREINHEEIVKTISSCQRDLVEFNLLLVPLYLTLTGFLFTDCLAQESSFADFKVPSTVTQLFNSFIHILLRVWLHKIGLSDLAEKLKFTNNPITLTSNVPKDIKKKLIGFGQISYDFLLEQKYTFKQEDLDRYLIEPEDVRASGLFCVSQHGNCIECFYTHKSMQEYMAAVYLSHSTVQFREYSFTRFVDKQCKDTPLQERFSKLSQVLRFLFGLEPEFAMQILKRVQGASVPTYFGRILLNYEAALFHEAEDLHLKKTLTDFLCRCQLTNATNIFAKFQASQKFIFSLCKALSKDQRISLLDKWYGLHISKDKKDLVLVNKDTGTANCKARISDIDEVFYFLLRDIFLKNIRTLTIDNLLVGDLDLLQIVFPRVQVVTIEHYDSAYETLSLKKLILPEQQLAENSAIPNDCTGLSPTITHVKIGGNFVIGGRCVSFSKRNIEGLINQRKLESLRLSVDILSQMDKTIISTVAWKKLTELEINIINEEHISMLLDLFLHTPKINSVTLSSDKVFSEEKVDMLLQSLTQPPLKDIHCLRVFGLLRLAGVRKLRDKLPQLQSLHTLGLSHADVVNADYQHSKQQGIIAKLARCPCITHLHLGFQPIGKHNALAACQVLIQDMVSPSHFLVCDRDIIQSMVGYLTLCVYDFEHFELAEFTQIIAKF